jgi:hypothetical protein
MNTRIKHLFSFLILGCIGSLFSQEIEGDWYGKLEQIQLNVVFHIDKNNNDYQATLDSPDQGGFGIPVDTVRFNDSRIEIIMTKLNATYVATFKNDSFSGTFSQNGFEIPLKLSKDKTEIKGIKKSQEPIRPFPYLEEEVTFKNGDVVLSGTFTKPASTKKHPVVILINGSGPQDRDEAIMGHKPFLVLSDFLTRKGIAVLRYDDRGFGKSIGDFSKATSEDFATDVESAVNYLNSRVDIDKKHIGLIGHSEGGLIAPMVAANNKHIDFIVLMAGTGIPGDSLLLLQQQLVGKVMGMQEAQLKTLKNLNQKSFDIINEYEDKSTIESELSKYLKSAIDTIPIENLPAGVINDDTFISTQVNLLTSPWMRYFLSYDPYKALEKVTCPVLAINGSNDLQVPAKENLSAIEAALNKGGNKNIMIKEFSGLNHMFQESETGAPSEYASIEQTISPEVLEEIYKWITKQIN